MRQRLPDRRGDLLGHLRGRGQFVAFKGGYHGDTTGAMAVSDSEEGMHAVFAGLLPRRFISELGQTNPCEEYEI